MNGHELKTLIAAGDYHPQAADVAQAMLRRRGVRELLMEGYAFGAGRNGKVGGPFNPAGRIPPAPHSPRQAA
ncbi:MAG TPA: hypothetical protein VHQ43_08475 [Solirubrobacterales bacterium]|jgi:hypothetical protein|nr:hypothetical protein [Solirubrobacterales bacterium]